MIGRVWSRSQLPGEKPLQRGGPLAPWTTSSRQPKWAAMGTAVPRHRKYNLLLNEDRAILGVAEAEPRSYVSQRGLEKGRRK
jgi:hypothetical protein